VVAAVRTGRPLAETAWQRFLPSGPLAFLPLPGALASIVWSTTEPHARELVAMEPGEFGLALETAIEGRLGRVALAGERGDFPLRRVSAHRYAARRVALVGDAAHTVHPLGGQGVNLGLQDAATLAELVLDALARGRDPGSTSVLARYERWRKAHNLPVQGALHGMHHLFGSRHPALRALRGAGLAATDRLGPLKGAIMRFAMGIDRGGPRAMRAPE
jgi:2-octaprenylphenol hydroxylase